VVLAGDRAPVWTGTQALTMLHRLPQGGTAELIAAGCERVELMTAEVAGKPPSWLARRLVSRSFRLAQAAARGGRARLAQAPAAVTALTERRRGQRRDPDPSPLRVAVDPLWARAQGRGLLHVRDTAHGWERPRRRYGRRAATGPREGEVPVAVSLDEAAGAAAVRQRGGRVSVTTQPPDQLSLQEAVPAYRRESLVERARGRLTGRPVSLTPRDLERDAQAPGVIRLLSLGWRVLTRPACGVRRRLAAAKTTLGGWSGGNPQRATAHPTAERLLAALPGVTLTLIRGGRRRRRHLPPLSRVHQRILALLNSSVDIYLRLCPASPQPP
jgi:hypothetical protein